MTEPLGTDALASPGVSITRTQRRRFFWAAWWTEPPRLSPFRKPDASDGGALTEAEAHAREALETKTALGSSGQPWMALNVLHDIARARGDEAGAQTLRQQAMEGYRRFRRAGGHSEVDRDVAAWFIAIGERLPEAGAIAPAVIGDLDALPEPRRRIADALIAFGRGEHAPAQAFVRSGAYRLAVEFGFLLDGEWP